MKRCGKSAPRVRQRNRHGKPHREQDRIGTATRVVRCKAKTPQGDVKLAVRVGCSRQCANIVPEEWPSRIVCLKQAVPYKTRLTGWLISYVAAFSGEMEFRFASRKHFLPKMRGSAPTRRTPLQFRLQSFRDGRQNQTSDGPLQIGESRQSALARFTGGPE